MSETAITSSKKTRATSKTKTGYSSKRVQCSKIITENQNQNQKQKQCKNQIKVAIEISHEEQFCYRHQPSDLEQKLHNYGEDQQVPETSGREEQHVPETSGREEQQVLEDNDSDEQQVPEANDDELFHCWDLWINPSIKNEARKEIWKRMNGKLPCTNSKGYIYVFTAEKTSSISKDHLTSEDPFASNDDYARFKIGVTGDPFTRERKFQEKCKRTITFIKYFPKISAENSPSAFIGKRATNRFLVDTFKCPYKFWVERMIRFELSALYGKYEHACDECQKIHKEWISVPRKQRTDGEKMTDEEIYSQQIKPVVQHWIKFILLASPFLPKKCDCENTVTGSLLKNYLKTSYF